MHSLSCNFYVWLQISVKLLLFGDLHNIENTYLCPEVCFSFTYFGHRLLVRPKSAGGKHVGWIDELAVMANLVVVELIFELIG